ncbi:MAG: alcohol dehydrogenase catalytic domain-containing protein [Planctomycetota bacterium]
MRAIQIVQPRKIAMLDDAPRPEPAEGEVLVRCSHVAICGSNMGQYTGKGLWADADYPNPVGWSGHEDIGTIVESRCDGWEEGALVLALPRRRVYRLSTSGDCSSAAKRARPGGADCCPAAGDGASGAYADRWRGRQELCGSRPGPNGIDIHTYVAVDGSEYGHCD